MTEIFVKILNMSIAAGFIVLAVVLLRWILRKAPKWLRCALWAIVALRLVLPVLPQSPLSLVPSSETFVVKYGSEEAGEPASLEIHSGIEVVNSYFSEAGQTGLAPGQTDSKTGLPETDSSQQGTVSGRTGTTQQGTDQIGPDTAQPGADTTQPGVVQPSTDTTQPGVQSAAKPSLQARLLGALGSFAWVWAAGVLLMLLYAAASYMRLRSRVRAAVKRESEVFVCDEAASPFILGVFRPRIYLPSGLSAEEEAHVLAHERAHLSRRDQFFKPLGFVLLAVYWFNPLMWLAYVLFCRDIELACDEKVVSRLEDKDRAAYSRALLSCSVPRRAIAACPLAFGEVGVKSRVKSVLNYKKPAFWLIILAVAACVALAACTLTDRSSGNNEMPDPSDQQEQNDIVIVNKFPLFAESDTPETTFTIDDFPGVTFSYDNASVRSPEGELPIKGLIMGLFRYDVTGDGKKDICAMVEQGSGHITLAVCVYDWENKTYYEIPYRGGSNRFLFAEEGRLLAGNFKSDDLNEFAIADAGKLVIKDGELTVDPDDSLIPAAEEVFERSKWAAQYNDYRPRRLDVLKELYPAYFGLDASNGLTVYLNSSEEYGVLAGKDGVLGYDDYENNYLKYNKYRGPSFVEIKSILDSYGIADDQVSFRPFCDPKAHDATKKLTLEAIQRLFSYRTGGEYTLGDWLETSGFEDPEADDKRSENRQPSRAMEEETIESWYRQTSPGEPENRGTCWKTFETWKEATDYLGFDIWNPLEDQDWLEKTGIAAADVEPEQIEGLKHAYLFWNGSYDGKINYYALEVGYMAGTVRVTLQITTNVYYQELYRHDRFTDKWHASEMWFEKNGYQYKAIVTGLDGPEAPDAAYDKVYDALFEMSDASDTGASTVMWFDNINGEKTLKEGTITVSGLKGRTFRYDGSSIYCSDGSVEKRISSDNPVLSAFFSDISEDGVPELCITSESMTPAGYDTTRYYITVYDFSDGAEYSLDQQNERSWGHDLIMRDGKLYAREIYAVGTEEVNILSSLKTLHIGGGNFSVNTLGKQESDDVLNNAASLNINGVQYYKSYRPVYRLPEGFEMAGRLTTVQAGSSALCGERYYTGPQKNIVYVNMWFAVCEQEGGASVMRRYWGFVPWVADGDAAAERAAEENEARDSSREKVKAITNKYPQFFGADTSEGLTVYVFSFASGQYSCGLLPGGTNMVDVAGSSLAGTVSAEDMKIILASYGLPDSMITVRPYYNPVSSYLIPDKEAYANELKALFDGRYEVGAPIAITQEKEWKELSVSKEMSQALKDDWRAWSSMSTEQQMLSTKMAGTCGKGFETWTEATAYLGSEPLNPFESAGWLRKMNCAGADIRQEGQDALQHVYLSWTGNDEGVANSYWLQAGYADGNVRIVVMIKAPEESTESARIHNPLRSDRSTDTYDASELEFVRYGCQYRIDVISYEGTEARDRVYNKVYELFFSQTGNAG